MFERMARKKKPLFVAAAAQPVALIWARNTSVIVDALFWKPS